MSSLASPRVGDLESVRRRCARQLQQQLQNPKLRAEKASSSVAPGSRSPTRALSPDIIPDVSPEALAAAANAETRLRQPRSLPPPARGSSSLRSPRGITQEEAESRPRMGRTMARSVEDLAESGSEGRLPRSRSAPRILCSPQQVSESEHAEKTQTIVASQNGDQLLVEQSAEKRELGGSINGVSIRSLSAARHEARAERSLGGNTGESPSSNAKGIGREPRHSSGSYTAAPTRSSRGSCALVTPLSPSSTRRPVASQGQAHTTQRSFRAPSGTNGTTLALGSASTNGGHSVSSQTSSSAVTAKNLAATMPSSARKSGPFATPRSGLGGSIRSAVPPRMREAGSVRTQPPAVSNAVPPQRNRSPSCTIRATSTPIQSDIPISRGRGRSDTVRSVPSYVPPQRSPRNSASSTAHRKAIVRVEPQNQIATVDSSGSATTSAQQTARVEQMSAVAQSLQAAALALQRVAAVSPGARTRAGIRVRDVGSPVRGDSKSVVVTSRSAPCSDTREVTAAKLAGAAQRVRANWLPPGNNGMLSMLSRENAALREALDDTTRKLNELEGRRVGGDSDVEEASAPCTVDNGTSNGHEVTQ